MSRRRIERGLPPVSTQANALGRLVDQIDHQPARVPRRTKPYYKPRGPSTIPHNPSTPERPTISPITSPSESTSPPQSGYIAQAPEQDNANINEDYGESDSKKVARPVDRDTDEASTDEYYGADDQPGHELRNDKGPAIDDDSGSEFNVAVANPVKTRRTRLASRKSRNTRVTAVASHDTDVGEDNGGHSQEDSEEVSRAPADNKRKSSQKACGIDGSSISPASRPASKKLRADARKGATAGASGWHISSFNDVHVRLSVATGYPPKDLTLAKKYPISEVDTIAKCRAALAADFGNEIVAQGFKGKAKILSYRVEKLMDIVDTQGKGTKQDDEIWDNLGRSSTEVFRRWIEDAKTGHVQGVLPRIQVLILDEHDPLAEDTEDYLLGRRRFLQSDNVSLPNGLIIGKRGHKGKRADGKTDADYMGRTESRETKVVVDGKKMNMDDHDLMKAKLDDYDASIERARKFAGQIMTLTEEQKKSQAENEELKKKNAAQEKKISVLEARLANLDLDADAQAKILTLEQQLETCRSAVVSMALDRQYARAGYADILDDNEQATSISSDEFAAVSALIALSRAPVVHTVASNGHPVVSDPVDGSGESSLRSSVNMRFEWDGYY
ncbi:uncharacterized protein HMPREF1541_02844 [Cyphellophora europaea CBS 101466]|uniref:Uncharacterized protein n=1 Tax=Cyphellophora europaea (strain CBS 101466) TaxID=1220924 RepID=W2S505_CYPE1|nr:uncharacterized protein HMPREF1541_02844 [Cyphellophora europaea CBS 101466]ETN43685.1 hypothetical protein HMPREF1541_02844 [Cyphellophora europaea CBS 101466]